jgi:hypothetical protein
MFWLAVIGLAITAVGGIMAAIGQAQKNVADKAKLEGNLPVYDAQQAALDAQLANIKAEKQAAADLAAINKQQIQENADLNIKQGEQALKQGVVQGIETSEAGAQAKGSAIARAGAGNVGGQSVLRQAQAIQTQTSRRVGLINAQQDVTRSQMDVVRSGAASDIRKQDIGLASTLGGLGVQELQTETSLLQSNVNETNTRADIKFLEDYGWLSVAAVGLGAAAQVIDTASNIDWSKAAPAKTPTSSLATENYGYDYRQWGDF